MTIQQEIVTKLLDKYPRHGKKTIARIAYKENPRCFPSLNSAYLQTRRITGAKGVRDRGEATVDRPHGQSGTDAFGKIPKQRNPFKTPGDAMQIDGPGKVLILQDIHIPYHDRKALLTALDYGKRRDPDVILLNGDAMDAHAVSYWQTDPRERDFAGELRDMREFLKVIRDSFKKARIIYKWGNHEERWESYMFAKAPEVLGVEDFELSALLRFDSLGIEEVKEKRLIRGGDLNIVHGHEHRGGMTNPVNAARGLFLRAKAYAFCGHFHQVSSHSDNDITGHSIATWSGGCLCLLRQGYAPFNNWRHGCAWEEIDRDGKFELFNHTIKSGRILG